MKAGEEIAARIVLFFGQICAFIIGLLLLPIAIEDISIHVAFETPPDTKHMGPHLEHLVKVRALMPGYLFA